MKRRWGSLGIAVIGTVAMFAPWTSSAQPSQRPTSMPSPEDRSPLGIAVPFTETIEETLRRIDDRLMNVEQKISEIAEKDSGWSDPRTIVPLLVGLVAAIAGFVVAFLTRATQKEIANITGELTQKNLREARLEEHVFNSLQWLSGGTQNRGIGIAVIDANWSRLPDLRQTWTSVLVTQAVYLLAQKEREKTAQHEITNLNNILRILKGAGEWLDDNLVSELERAIKARQKENERAIEVRRDDKKLGIELDEKNEEGWRDFVQNSRMRSPSSR